ncbi:hypothetical protein MYA98_26835 [Salmonella sp. WGH-01]|nr:hypothetical protein MYA98_26835 [Salmonella sp. WGH-01]
MSDGESSRLTTDIGPVIDSEAKANIERHIQTMRAKGRPVFRAARENSDDAQEWQTGTFVMPTLIELENFAELEKRSSGPCCTSCVITVTNWRSLSNRLTLPATG